MKNPLIAATLMILQWCATVWSHLHFFVARRMPKAFYFAGVLFRFFLPDLDLPVRGAGLINSIYQRCRSKLIWHTVSHIWPISARISTWGKMRNFDSIFVLGCLWVTPEQEKYKKSFSSKQDCNLQIPSSIIYAHRSEHIFFIFFSKFSSTLAEKSPDFSRSSYCSSSNTRYSPK